jgi:hypothetical protein
MGDGLGDNVDKRWELEKKKKIRLKGNSQPWGRVLVLGEAS